MGDRIGEEMFHGLSQCRRRESGDLYQVIVVEAE